jgi:hypothetical protein
VPAFLDQAGAPAERLRQHAQLAGYRLDVTILLAFPAGRLDAQQNAAPLSLSSLPSMAGIAPPRSSRIVIRPPMP